MQKTLNTSSSFRNYIFIQQRECLSITLLGMLCAFQIYKLVYSDPDFSRASFSYLGMAAQKADSFNAYLFFLRGIHVITVSAYWLIAIQYLVLQLSSLWLMLSTMYVLQTSNRIRNVILTWLVFNPLTLYLSNHISSDALFASLSFCWFSLILMLFRRVNYLGMVMQSVVLVSLVSMRYQALYYLLLMLLVMGGVKGGYFWKLVATLITVVSVIGTLQLKGVFIATGWRFADNVMTVQTAVPVYVTTTTQPASRIRYFVWLLLPQKEQFAVYSMNRKSMKMEAWTWFKSPSIWLNCHWYRGAYYLLWIFPYLFWLVHAGIVVVLLFGRKSIVWKRLAAEQWYSLLLLLLAVAANLLFGIITAPMILRCQLSVFVMGIIFLLCADELIRNNYSD